MPGSLSRLEWLLSSSSSPDALAVVDGTGKFSMHGPHYSRRTPGSKTFTGVGQEIVLITSDLTAVWACVRQRTPSKRGSGASRGRFGVTDDNPRYVWRNMLFRNLGKELSSELIRTALSRTYEEWVNRYGELPPERLRTEIDIRRVKSRNPGYCYKIAGWTKDRIVRGKLYLFAPDISESVDHTPLIHRCGGRVTCPSCRSPGAVYRLGDRRKKLTV
jgi:hypothetical protein